MYLPYKNYSHKLLSEQPKTFSNKLSCSYILFSSVIFASRVAMFQANQLRPHQSPLKPALGSVSHYNTHTVLLYLV